MSNLPVIPGAPNLVDWVSAHVWPSYITSKVKMERVMKQGEEFKSTASEALSIYPVIRSFLQRYRMLEHDDIDVAICVQSFLAVCSLLDTLKSSMCGEVNPEELHDKVVCHLCSFSAAYGECKFIPKHHYCLHLAQGAARHGILLSTFVHERRHKLVKRFATEIANAGAWFEKSVEIEGGVAHINHLSGDDEDDLPTFIDDCRLRLVGACKEIPDECRLSLGDFLNMRIVGGVTSKRAVGANGRIISEDDVVHVSLGGLDHVASVRLHVLVNQTLFTLITLWDSGNDVNSFIQSDDNHVWAETRQILGCYVYRWDAHDTIAVVPPYV